MLTLPSILHQKKDFTTLDYSKGARGLPV